MVDPDRIKTVATGLEEAIIAYSYTTYASILMGLGSAGLIRQLFDAMDALVLHQEFDGTILVALYLTLFGIGLSSNYCAHETMRPRS